MDSNTLKLLIRLEAIDKATRPIRGLKGAARDSRDAIKALQERMSALKATSADISGYKAQNAALATLTAKLAKQRETVAELTAAYEKAEKPTDQLKTNWSNATQALKRLDGELEQHGVQLRDAKAKLEAAGMSTDKLGDHEQRLAAELADTNFQLRTQKDLLSRVAKAQRQTDEARTRYQRTNAMAGNIAGSGAGAIGMGLAVAAPLKDGVDRANELQSAVTTIAQRSNMATDAARRFSLRMLDAARAANQTRAETTATFDELTAQGFDSTTALEMAKAVGRASTAYHENGQEVARAAGSFRNLKIEAKDTARGLDIMAVAGKAGNFEFGDMARAFPSLTAQAEAYGMTGTAAIADISAALQIARRGAGSSEEAATNLENVLQKIGSPETAKNFAKVGINLREEMQKGKKAGVSALETIIELTRRATGGDATKLGSFFQDAQVQNGLRPLLSATADYRQIRADAMKAGKVVDIDFDRRMRDSAEASKAASIAFDRTRVLVGQGLQPAFVAVSHVVTTVSNAFNAWATKNPALVGTLAVILATIAALLLIFGGLAIAVAAVMAPFAALQLATTLGAAGWATFTGGLWGAISATWAWTAALLANPVTWIVLAVIALAAAAYLIYRNWGPISAWFGSLWAGIVAFAGRAIEAIKFYIMNFTPVGLFVRAFTAVWTFLQGLGARFHGFGGQLLMGLINGILGGIPGLIAVIISAGGRLIAAFREKMGIHSPSRVFAGFGDHTMGGLALGIERSGRHPLAALANVGAAMTGALAIGAGSSPALASPSAAAAGGVARGGDTYEIHVHAAPGQDPEAIARLVLEKIQQLQSNSRRSSYRDDPE
jgi:TP901 family phage tail tape measure protein